MQDWRQAMRSTEDFDERRLLLRHRNAVGRLLQLGLRDRWGYELEPAKLARLADYVVLNSDQENLFRNSRRDGVITEAVDRLAVGMLTEDIPMVCDGYDTPAEDETLRTIIETIIEEKA